MKRSYMHPNAEPLRSSQLKDIITVSGEPSWGLIPSDKTPAFGDDDINIIF